MKPGDLISYNVDCNSRYFGFGLWKNNGIGEVPVVRVGILGSDRVRDLVNGEVALVIHCGQSEFVFVLVGSQVGWVDSDGWKRVTR